jgi:hypothetical protein
MRATTSCEQLKRIMDWARAPCAKSANASVLHFIFEPLIEKRESVERQGPQVLGKLRRQDTRHKAGNEPALQQEFGASKP